MTKYLLCLLLLLIPVRVFAATHYVWCGAAGGATGADFTNATTDLPASLVRGDTYVVAGSASCTYGVHVFSDAESGTLVITVRKAEASLDSGVAGWQASFATAQAKWTEPLNSDPESQTGNSVVWRICRNHYAIDGITGTVDPSAGGPTGFGFIVETPNFLSNGLVNISDNSCGPHTSFTNITIAHTEITSVERYLNATVGTCLFSSPTVTVTLSPAPSWTILNGDLMSAFNSTPTVVDDGSGHSLLGLAAASVIGSPTTGYSFNVPAGYVGNPCTQISPIVTVGLEFGGTIGIKMLFTNNTFSNMNFSYDYIHDTSGTTLTTSGMNTVTFDHNYFARNRGTPTQHANGIDDHVGGGISSNNVTFSYNHWQDIGGTAVISVFNQLSGSLLTDNSWNIYGNVFWNTDPTTNATSQWIDCFGVTAQPVACSHWKIYNNTIYNLSASANGDNARVSLLGSDPSSTDVEVYDNLWALSNNVAPFGSVDQTTVCFDETAACASTAQIVSDYNYYTLNTGQNPPSEAHGQLTSLVPFIDVAVNNFLLSGETNDGLHFASPFNMDALGNTRGADGVWEPGAFEFQATASRGGLGLLNSAHP